MARARRRGRERSLDNKPAAPRPSTARGSGGGDVVKHEHSSAMRSMCVGRESRHRVGCREARIGLHRLRRPYCGRARPPRSRHESVEAMEKTRTQTIRRTARGVPVPGTRDDRVGPVADVLRGFSVVVSVQSKADRRDVATSAAAAKRDRPRRAHRRDRVSRRQASHDSQKRCNLARSSLG